MKVRYMLLKDCPELKKGAILECNCDSGTQGFGVISHDWDQKEIDYLYGVGNKIVTEQPEWFEKVDLLWLTKIQMEKVKKLLKI